jgi:hypothetical protein
VQQVGQVRLDGSDAVNVGLLLGQGSGPLGGLVGLVEPAEQVKGPGLVVPRGNAHLDGTRLPGGSGAAGEGAQRLVGVPSR